MGKIYGYARVSTRTQRLDRQTNNIVKAFPDVSRIYTEKFTGTEVDGRTEFAKMLKTAKVGDILVFDSVSRFSRTAEEGFSLYEELFNKGVELVFLKEQYINTAVYREKLKKQIDLTISTGNNATDHLMNNIIEALNNFLMDLAQEQIKIAFEQSEKEVQDLRKRVSEGMQETQKKNLKLPKEERTQIGQRKGAKLTTKKSIIAKKLIVENSKYFGGELNDKKVIALLKGYEFINDAGHKQTLGISNNTYYKYKRELAKERGMTV